MALTSQRLLASIEKIQERLDELDDATLKSNEKTADITFQEHFDFQQLQAEMHSSGVLTPGAAQIVYIALGDSFTETNGGWAKGTKLATKIVVTKLMAELLNLKLLRLQKVQ